MPGLALLGAGDPHEPQDARTRQEAGGHREGDRHPVEMEAREEGGRQQEEITAAASSAVSPKRRQIQTSRPANATFAASSRG